MIISRTPFRISFFGGGTDYPGWFALNKGAVLAATIDKYCYITCRYLPPFFEHRSRIIYSQMEHVKKLDEIDHPAVREVLRFLKIREGVEIHHDGDLPARTGLGSSSSFTVGLLNGLYALKGIMPTKERLAKEAIYIEQEMCKDNVGCQDQVLAAYGGLNFIEFGGKDHLRIQKMPLAAKRLTLLQNHIMMFFTGFHRPPKKRSKLISPTGDTKELKRTPSSDIVAYQLKEMPKKERQYRHLYHMTLHAVDLLNQGEMTSFGKLLHEGWMLKKNLSSHITTSHIDHIYDTAIRAGALGGKILGAGGGGFIVFFAKPGSQKRIREKLRNLLEIPVKLEDQGSQIIFYDPTTGKVD